MIQIAIQSKVHLVSIDSPLSIPKGRTSFFDNDPYRNEFGITRECERILKRRGINVYPCLLPSMQRLTQRGMILAHKFRKLGIPVIESYPGAAQDIMSIPRKQAGLEYLVEGLTEFGLKGEFTNSHVSHDEVDAITSALVGHFFWVGMYEALGNPDEEYLIIPDLNADYRSWLSREIIGLSGSDVSFRTTLAEYLAQKGYVSSTFDSISADTNTEKRMDSPHPSSNEISWSVLRGRNHRWLGKKCIESIAGQRFVFIDGLRSPEDHALMQESYGPSFYHIHVIAPSGLAQPEISKPTNPAYTQDAESGSANELAKVAHLCLSEPGKMENLLGQLELFFG